MAGEALALGSFVGEGVGAATAMIGDTHRAIASRVFGLVPAPAPARLLHDGISALVYAAVRASLAAASTGAGLAAEVAGSSGRRPPLGATARGRIVVGAVNGAWGDLLAERGSPLAVRMHVPDLEARRVAATPRIAVFVHGLCESEDAWRLGADRHRPYVERLRREYGYTPLVIRYNTGLHISENGRLLAGLLEEITGDWPVGVERIVLVGHSMGGIVARSACHCASGHDLRWVRRVTHVFSLGSPLDGADLEKAANVAGWALGKLPETRALARALNRRSAGIKDLRFGNFTEDCWRGKDPDALLENSRSSIPWLESAQHTFIAATLSRDPDHPVGRILGDVLVRRPSAWGRGQHGELGEFAVERSHCVPSANHFTLLNHPDVYAQIRRQLDTERGLPPAGRRALAS